MIVRISLNNRLFACLIKNKEELKMKKVTFKIVSLITAIIVSHSLYAAGDVATYTVNSTESTLKWLGTKHGGQHNGNVTIK